MINSIVEGCNSSLKATKIRPMGHLEIMQIFCSFTSGWNNLNRWIFKGNLFFKKYFVFMVISNVCRTVSRQGDGSRAAHVVFHISDLTQ